MADVRFLRRAPGGAAARAGVALLGAVAIAGVCGLAAADPPLTGPSDTYKPRLGDIMGATQLRHIKLWYAGADQNWALAGYELEQIKDSFQDAMVLYPGLPTANMLPMAGPSTALDAAIRAKDRKAFARAFNQMTAACNACHQSQGYGAIVIKVPNSSPFSDEMFPPKGGGAQ
ncbi:MAG TPA: hypothetical protein VLV50_02225 [Stellaceae bacterium]|nr:hypothetical protein [Stellaceae bacterium]